MVMMTMTSIDDYDDNGDENYGNDGDDDNDDNDYNVHVLLFVMMITYGDNGTGANHILFHTHPSCEVTQVLIQLEILPT